MGNGHLIDSNVVIDYLDNKLPVKATEIMNSIIDDRPNISIISKIEILRFNTTNNIYKVLKDFIDECVILGLNDLVVEKTIEICKTRKIKLPDAIIAATAIVYELTLITRNISDFKNVEGLQMSNLWE